MKIIDQEEKEIDRFYQGRTQSMRVENNSKNTFNDDNKNSKK